MKYLLVIILVVPFLLRANTELNLNTENRKNIKHNYIGMIARQIFSDETKIVNFIAIQCFVDTKFKNSGKWFCIIQQTASNFNGETYTVLAPHEGSWILEIDFKLNVYSLKKV